MVSHDSNKIGEIHRELHSHLPPEPALRVKALETVLIEKGFLKEDTIDNWLENYAEKIGPKNGAMVIARAWTDPKFAALLERDAVAAFRAGTTRSPFHAQTSDLQHRRAHCPSDRMRRRR